jgi:hypothetical protein
MRGWAAGVGGALPAIALTLGAIFVCPHWVGVGEATSIIPRSLQAVVLESDLIGILECDVAGGMVAKYRVVEAWKGPPAGSSVLLGATPGPHGPGYPLALVGDRFLVAAKENRSRWGRTGSFSALPWGGQLLSFRRFEGVAFTAYTTMFDWIRLPDSDREPVPVFGGAGAASVDSIRRAITEILSSERSLEGEALKAQSLLLLEGPFARAPTDRGGGEAARLRHVLSTRDPAAITDTLIAISMTNGEWDLFARTILQQAGGSVALRRLEQYPWPDPARTGSRVRHATDQIQSRMKANRRWDFAEEVAEMRVDPHVDPDSMRRAVRAGWRTPAFQKAFERMTATAPEFVAEFLAEFTDTSTADPFHSVATLIGSYFAWRCPAPRLTRLRRLLDAKDPAIRVAAATYICYEDSAEGTRLLSDLKLLHGDPGSWAAYELARRGDPSSVPRALEAWRVAGPDQFGQSTHRVLQLRILELLSNSAARSGTALPPRPPDENAWEKESNTSYYHRLTTWWAGVAPRIGTHDPWLVGFADQKVD